MFQHDAFLWRPPECSFTSSYPLLALIVFITALAEWDPLDKVICKAVGMAVEVRTEKEPALCDTQPFFLLFHLGALRLIMLGKQILKVFMKTICLRSGPRPKHVT